MVYLYGITHGGQLNDFLMGHTEEIEVFPTKELATDLLQFPKECKIGLECLTKSDWDEVNQHILTLPFNPPEPRFEDQKYASRPYYMRDGNDDYWSVLEKVCLGLGFEVMHLEDKNIWFRYNELMIKVAENMARRENLQVKESGESEKHYHEKMTGFSLEEHRESVFLRRIHEIERDDNLLRRIKSSKIDVAVVGIGHSDYWMANPQVIETNFGVSFDSYSTEIPAKEDSYWRGSTCFTKNANPNLRMAFVRNSLGRAIQLMETGRLDDRTPDLVGTWNIDNPMKGYFEMFIKRNGKSINGRIVDCLGDATFEGEIGSRDIRFIKKYLQGQCCDGAASGEIVYNGIVRDGRITGYFVVPGFFPQPFYATPEQTRDFLNLGMAWRLSSKRYGKATRSLRNSLL